MYKDEESKLFAFIVIWFSLRICIFRAGNKELLVTSTIDSQAWFSIVHSSSSLDPVIVLAKNSTSLMTTQTTGNNSANDKLMIFFLFS